MGEARLRELEKKGTENKEALEELKRKLAERHDTSNYRMFCAVPRAVVEELDVTFFDFYNCNKIEIKSNWSRNFLYLPDDRADLRNSAADMVLIPLRAYQKNLGPLEPWLVRMRPNAETVLRPWMSQVVWRQP